MRLCILKIIKRNDDPILEQLTRVLSPLSGSIYLISPNFCGFVHGENKKNLKDQRHRSKLSGRLGCSFVDRFAPLGYLQKQLSLTLDVLLGRNAYDTVFLYTGAGPLVLPVVALRMLSKKIVFVYSGSLSLSATIIYGHRLYGKIMSIMEKLSLKLSDIIIVYTRSCVREFGLAAYSQKIAFGHEHFVNMNKFRIKKNLRDRADMIGFIGRLSEEKGILNFVRAVPKVLEKKRGASFAIGGGGHLYDQVTERLKNEKLNDKVKMFGRISHETVPEFLNELKLLVIPSYTEGLPNVMLEAMACGTPVLATPVGAISDVLVDGINGFLLESNAEDSIAEAILCILERQDLQEIAEQGVETIKKDFTLESAIGTYKKVLEKVNR